MYINLGTISLLKNMTQTENRTSTHDVHIEHTSAYDKDTTVEAAEDSGAYVPFFTWDRFTQTLKSFMFPVDWGVDLDDTDASELPVVYDSSSDYDSSSEPNCDGSNLDGMNYVDIRNADDLGAMTTDNVNDT